MSREAVKAELSKLRAKLRLKFTATLTAGEQTWKIDGDLADYDFDMDKTIDKAYKFGREGSDDARMSEIDRAMRQGVELKAEMDWNRDKVIEFIREAMDSAEVLPTNAKVVAFRPENLPGAEAWEFAPGTMGAVIEGKEDFEAQVLDALEKGEYGKTFEMTLREEPPTLSLAQLQTSCTRFSSYTTNISDNADRMTNIELASKYINGTILMPGEVFSYNKNVGPRTEERGFKEQLIPINGEMVPDPGGGVCQVAGTLYQAVLCGSPNKTDLEIVERRPHSIKSTYMEPAMDATVYYGNIDFRFKNNRSTPVYIVRSFDRSSRTIKMSLYGAPLPEGMTIKTSSEVTATEPEPTEVREEIDYSMKPGEEKVSVIARPGTRAKCWRTVFVNGTQQGEKELVNESYYKPTIKTIKKGPGGATPTPSLPPEAAEPTPAPPAEPFFQDPPPDNNPPADQPPEENGGNE